MAQPPPPCPEGGVNHPPPPPRSLRGTPKILGKEGKSAPKNAWKIGKQNNQGNRQKNKQGLEGQGGELTHLTLKGMTTKRSSASASCLLSCVLMKGLCSCCALLIAWVCCICCAWCHTSVSALPLAGRRKGDRVMAYLSPKNTLSAGNSLVTVEFKIIPYRVLLFLNYLP